MARAGLEGCGGSRQALKEVCGQPSLGFAGRISQVWGVVCHCGGCAGLTPAACVEVCCCASDAATILLTWCTKGWKAQGTFLHSSPDVPHHYSKEPTQCSAPNLHRGEHLKLEAHGYMVGFARRTETSYCPPLCFLQQESQLLHPYSLPACP